MAFYKKVGNSAICDVKDGDEVRYFIPERWFNAGIAFVTGEFINLIGCFSYALYDSKNKPIGKLRNFNFPTAFLCQPYKVDKMKDIRLTKYEDPTDYRVLRFKKGDKLIVEIDVPKMVENVEDMFKMFVITGHIPTNIPYIQLHQYFLDNVEYSGNKYNGVPTQMIGIFISELARDIHDPSKPFRLSPEKKKEDYTAYKSISVKDIPKYKSAYQAFTSEQFDEAVISAIQSDNTNYSPLERVLMGTPNEDQNKAKQ